MSRRAAALIVMLWVFGPAGLYAANSAPVVTVPSNPVRVALGATIQLVADVEDVDGDALEYSFVFLQTGATVASSAISVEVLTATKKRVRATFPGPPAGGTFEFRFTARETNTTDHKTASAVITLIVGPTANQPPVAKIQYKIGSSAYANAPAAPVVIETGTAVNVTLSGETSTDDGDIEYRTYAWSRQSSITAGGVTLGNATGPITTIDIAAHTIGTLTATLTVKDEGNLTNSASIIFDIVEPSVRPIARVMAKIGNQPLTGSAEAGAILTLDGSASSRPDNTKNNLTYQWTQTGGPNVTITDANRAVAQFTVPAATQDPAWLSFSLVVTDGSTASEPAKLTVTLASLSFYFSQVAVGPLGTSQFRTVLLLVNRTDGPANGVRVKFFGQDGNPMNVTINGMPWDNQPFSIPSLSARRLVFTGQELTAGWAKVEANARVGGLLQYQIVGQDEDLESQVGLYATDAATKFATFFDVESETAIAVANPTSQPATVTIAIKDEQTGSLIVQKNLFALEPGAVLPGMNHKAKFLTREFLGELPRSFSVGSLLIESNVPIAVTILQTRGGVVFSTLPVVLTQ